jgi:hypothetical protein
MPEKDMTCVYTDMESMELSWVSPPYEAHCIAAKEEQDLLVS